MKINFTDPEILIPIGVIIVCVVAFAWAIGQIFKKSAPPEPLLDDLSPTAGDNDLFGSTPDALPSVPLPEFTEPPMPPPPAAVRPGVPPVSKEMVERLDTMSQRLSDMQTVLQRQAVTPAGGSLAPETIDKLLKIVGSVTQQVDLLQRSMGAAPANPALGQAAATPAAPAPLNPPPAAAAKPPAPAPAPARPPTPAPTPAPAPAPTAPAPATPNVPPPAAAKPAPSAAKPSIIPEPSGKGIGLVGGALSKVKPAASGNTEPGNAGATPPANPAGQ